MTIPQDVQARFFSKIQALKTRGQEFDDYWLWLGGITKNGYGALWVGGKKGKAEYAHRIAYQIAHNTDIPYYLCIHHKCNQKHCVNPDHLELTTYSANNYASYLEHRLEE